MQPRPSADTSKPLFPSLRFCMVESFLRSTAEETLAHMDEACASGLARPVAILLCNAGVDLALAAIVARGKAGLPAEQLGEMAGVGVSDIKRNGHYALLRFTEQALRFFNPQIDVVAQRRHSDSAFEEAKKMKLAQTGLCCKLVQTEFFGHVFRHPLCDLSNLVPRQRRTAVARSLHQFRIVASKVNCDSVTESFHKKRAGLATHQFILQSFHQRVEGVVGEGRNIPKSRVAGMFSEDFLKGALQQRQLKEYRHAYEWFVADRFPPAIVGRTSIG